MIEVCHGIEPVPQPSPARNEGGDCFACAATAGLRFLYPEREISLEEVWEKFVVEYYDGKAQNNLQRLREAVAPIAGVPKPQGLEMLGALQELERIYADVSAEKPDTTICNDWYGFKKVLDNVSHEWGRLETTWDMVQPTFESNHGRPHWSYPWRFQDLSLPYTQRLEGWLRGGWVAFAEVKYGGGGPFVVEDGRPMLTSPDHFVVIDGIRHEYVERRDPETDAFESGSWQDSIHVVDSAGGLNGWHETMPFTRSHAASSWWLARRDTR